MKRTALMLMMLFCGAAVFAQEDTEMKTLFGGGGIRSHGGYGGVTTAYTNMDDRDAILIGGRGAWLINHTVGIGIAGYGFMSESKFDNTLSNRYQLLGGYGGLFLEFIVNPSSPVHLSFPLTVGAGGVSYARNDRTFPRDSNFLDEDSQAFFVVEPGVELELNLIKIMRIAFGVSYRYTSSIGLNYLNNGGRIIAEDALRGFNAGVTLKFGKF